VWGRLRSSESWLLWGCAVSTWSSIVVPVGKMYESVLCDAGDSDYDRLVVVAVSYYFYVPLLYPPAASILCTQHSARRTWYD
jgi:hypothetical protein